MKTKREGYEEYMKRKTREETRGRKPRFTQGRKTMAVDFEPSTYNQVSDLSKEFTAKAGKHISKGELVRTAVNYWIEQNAPYSIEL